MSMTQADLRELGQTKSFTANADLSPEFSSIVFTDMDFGWPPDKFSSVNVRLRVQTQLIKTMTRNNIQKI